MHNDIVDQGALADAKRRTRRRIKQRQRNVLAAVRQQIARHFQAVHHLFRAKAIGAVANLARLQNAKCAILKDKPKAIREFPSIIFQLRETSRHFVLSSV